MSKIDDISDKLTFAKTKLTMHQRIRTTAKAGIPVGIAITTSTVILPQGLALGVGIPLLVVSLVVFALTHLLTLDRRPPAPDHDYLRLAEPAGMPDRYMNSIDYWGWKVSRLERELSEELMSS